MVFAVFMVFGFVLCTPMLSVSQDCTFLIAPLVFSNINIFHSIDLKCILVSLTRTRNIYDRVIYLLENSFHISIS
jgi:hypothetical protein